MRRLNFDMYDGVRKKICKKLLYEIDINFDDTFIIHRITIYPFDCRHRRLSANQICTHNSCKYTHSASFAALGNTNSKGCVCEMKRLPHAIYRMALQMVRRIEFDVVKSNTHTHTYIHTLTANPSLSVVI